MAIRTAINALVWSSLGALVALQLSTPQQELLDAEFARGKEAGNREALQTRPPSEKLELVCAGLWFSDQTLKHRYLEEKRRMIHELKGTCAKT